MTPVCNVIGASIAQAKIDLLKKQMAKVKAEGHERGVRDRELDKPEPYPPYDIGTQEANWWLIAYREGRHPE